MFWKDFMEQEIGEFIEKMNNDFSASNLEKLLVFSGVIEIGIKAELISITEFFERYNYKFYREIQYKEGCISHCGYPDYMWQSGAERNIYKISSNS